VQGASPHSKPYEYQRQRSALWLEQFDDVVNCAHGSATIGQSHDGQGAPGGQGAQEHGGGAGAAAPTVGSGSAAMLPELGPLDVPLPPAEVIPAPQLQSQAGQFGPEHAGQAQVQVPVTGPPPQAPPPPSQSHVHGAQLAPGGQAGQVQAQVPPPVSPPLGGAQSHCTAGQSEFDGQAIGRRQAQPPPEASRRWQKPAAPQSPPTGQSVTASFVFAAVQAQRASVTQPFSVIMPMHGSGVTQAPRGQVAPVGHDSVGSSTHEQA
jgi:hypothetical protein